MRDASLHDHIPVRPETFWQGALPELEATDTAAEDLIHGKL